MKPHLLFEQSNMSSRKTADKPELVQDLNLHVIFEAMAQNDTFLYNTAKSVILNSTTDIKTIIYRQEILKDCISNKESVLKLYVLASSALKEAAYYNEFNQPSYARIVPASDRVQKALGLLEILIIKLEELKKMFASITFESKGLSALCIQMEQLLTDEFFVKVREHIADLVSLSASGKLVISSLIGNGMKGAGHVLRKITDSRQKSQRNCSRIIPLDNISIADSAHEIKNAGLIHLLRVINDFTSSIMNFFEEFRYEIGFYSGCINLNCILADVGSSVCYPVPEVQGKKAMVFDGLYDVSMAVKERKKLVTNNLDANGKNLFVITGANQGGKSTFLRSIGLAQIFMQCGMFVPASHFCANICDNVFTHFTREEDINMNSGKLDEELSRMNSIINAITPDSLLLMNESFMTTTERDAFGIARDIIKALYESNIKVIYVTHLFEFANYTYNLKLEKTIFLRAERNSNGSRTFCMKPGEPLQTSYGEDLFKLMLYNDQVKVNLGEPR